MATGAESGISNEDFKLSLDPAAYEALEKDFQEVLQELVGEQSLEKFRIEFEKLHKAFKTSYESEKRHIMGAAKVMQEDSKNIALMR